MTAGAPAPLGRIEPLLRVHDRAVDPLRLFAALSEQGRRPHALLFESAEHGRPTAVKSLGTADPALTLTVRGPQFAYTALNATGERVLGALRGRLPFAAALHETPGGLGPAALTGRLPRPRPGLDERARLREPGALDLLRALHGLFALTADPGVPAGGLFGVFAYDFIDHFEALPPAPADPQAVPDLAFAFVDHLFVVDHEHDRTLFVASALGLPDPAADRGRAQERIQQYEAAFAALPPLEPLPPPPVLAPGAVTTDLDAAAYAAVVARLQEHIRAGDVFQIVPSRRFVAPLAETPLAVYRRLRALNPSPYMFFVRQGEHTLLGASPETALRYTAGSRTVEIRPIAGTRPRGLVGAALDPDLDARYETELRLDPKELAEHVMLVDLARNDVARVSAPGSRRAERLFAVEKYSHVQHLVSRVAGQLAPGLDPLHAYLATMNMGTLTGAPKVEAMRLLRTAEATARGFYGGAVGHWLLNGDFDTAIVIRALQCTADTAIARAGAGVVYDSDPAREADETAAKARAPLMALGLPPAAAAGGQLP